MPTKKRKFDISERAMLAVLKFSRWHPHVVDAAATDEVSENHQADKDAGKYYKALVPKNALKGVRAAENLIRSEHIAMTLPWADDGARILGQFAYSKYVERINKAKAVYAEQVAEFVGEYPRYHEEAKKRLKSLYSASDYPSAASIRGMFRAEIRIRPIESASDFRCDLGEDTENICKAIEAEVRSTYEDGIKGVWKGLHDSISKAVTRLKEYSSQVKSNAEVKGFRPTLITNIQEQVDLLPFLNIMGDPALDEFAGRIKKEITSYDADQLKDNDTVRDQVVEAADAILDKMAAFI